MVHRHSSVRVWGTLCIAGAALLANASCAGLDQLLGSGLIQPPEVKFLGATLVKAPSQYDLSAYYCPRVIQERVGIGAAANLICSRLFGRPPDTSAMQIEFDLGFQVANPNRLPLPLSEVLTALTVFPDRSNQSLGAVCLRMCEPGDARCQGGADSGGCREAPGDIKTVKDFPNALGQLLVARGVAAAGGQPAGFTAPKVLSGASVDVTARLGLLPGALLPVMEQLARQSVDQLRAGKPISAEIPYRVEGTVFGDLGSLGRVAAGFGPAAGTWPIPVDRL
jgi:hypothetical protein